MQKIINTISSLTLFFLFLMLAPIPVYAQTDQRLDITVSPIFFDFTTAPGKEIKDKIRLRNNGDTPLNLKLELKKLTASDVREANLEDFKPEDTYNTWVKFDNTTITAPAKEWIDIPFTITIPADANFGYYMAAAVRQDDTTPQTDQPTAVIQGSAAVPILLKVDSPNTKAAAELVEFKTRNFINEYLPSEFEVKVKNTGNIHIKPRGNIFIRGTSEKDLAILEVNPEMSTVLPQGSRVFKTDWSEGFFVLEKDESSGVLKHRLKINWDKLTEFRFGPYTASVLMVYDDGTRDVTLESKTSFWVIPYKLIAGAIIILIILIIGIKLMLRSYIKSQISKHHQ